MLPPGLIPIPPGTFHRWLAAAGKLGDQHKVPRVTSTRVLAEAVLAARGTGAPGPAGEELHQAVITR
jgi:hypothetical protein